MQQCLINVISVVILLIYSVILSIPFLAQTKDMAHQTPIHVAVNGSKNDPTCSSSVNWSNPCDLEYALNSQAAANDKIWVKAGNYVSSAENKKSNSYRLKSGVEVYGGFIGNENDRSQRDWVGTATILQDTHGEPHPIFVVTTNQADKFTILDSFAVTGDSGIQFEYRHLTMQNLVIRDNLFGDNGARLEDNYGQVVLPTIQFVNNLVVNGGAIYSNNGLVMVKDTKFQNNSVSQGYGGTKWN